MKKLCLLLCPMALMALGTSAHAGTYLAVSTGTYYGGNTSVSAVSAYAPKINPNNPTGPKLSQDSASNAPTAPSVSQKTWVWGTNDPVNDSAPSEIIRCSYSIACTPSASGTNQISRAEGSAAFEVSGQANAQLSYYQGISHGYSYSQLLPNTTTGQPITQWTQYANGGTVYPTVHDDDEQSYIYAQASVTASNRAYVSGADEPEYGNAASGQASIQITDFDCPDQPH